LLFIRIQARAGLRGIYARFTGGFAYPDLQDAAELIGDVEPTSPAQNLQEFFQANPMDASRPLHRQRLCGQSPHRVAPQRA